MFPWRVKISTQNFLMLLLLLMLMMRIVLATVCCRFRSWGLVKMLNFCSDFEHKVWPRFWSWTFGKILKLEFGWYFATNVLWRLLSWTLVENLMLDLVYIQYKFKFSPDAEVWLRFCSWLLVEILKMKFDQDLCKNGSVMPLVMFIYDIWYSISLFLRLRIIRLQLRWDRQWQLWEYIQSFLPDLRPRTRYFGQKKFQNQKTKKS